jgi:hypothetical protein
MTRTRLPAERLMRAAGKATETAVKSGELALASAEVIARRLAMTGAPAAAEVALMIPEKTQAFTASATAAAASMGEIALRGARAAAREGERAAQAGFEMAAATNLAEFALAQTRYFTGWLTRATAETAHMAGLAARAQAEALAPVHRTATANAKRLRRP